MLNAKTCQLCGKPLSRLRVGADGDFCSREHRNQYRLRLGMDRLHEADKVASLMRRRENPRQLGAARLMRNSAGANRWFESPKLMATQPATHGFSPAFSALGTTSTIRPRLVTEPRGYRQPAPSGLPAASAAPRPDTAQVRLTGRGNKPMAPERAVKLAAKLAPARISPLRKMAPVAAARRRHFDVLPHSRVRVELGQALTMLRRADIQGKVSVHQAPRICKLRTSPLNGNALRVSTALGFHVTPARQRSYASQPSMACRLAWPETPHSVTPEAAGHPAEVKLLRLDAAVPKPWPPAGPRPGRAARFKGADMVEMAPRKPVAGSKNPARFSGVNWNPQDPQWAGSVPGPASAGFARGDGARLFTLPNEPQTIDTVCQVAFAPILAQDSPIGYPHVAIHETLAPVILNPGNLTGASGKGAAHKDNTPPGDAAPAPVLTRVEEHFDNGWANWTGGMADWLVDVAGVRTGSLALFTPSLDMIDYELEFLARIDHRSVSWVIRAAGLEEYCRCTLTAMPGGELEFSRCAVFDGAAEPVVVAATRIAVKPKSAMTVRTRLDGGTVIVSMDGKVIDTWNEARLPIGGIGFLGAPDDRARLYWVRLSFSVSPGKEYQKR